MEAINWGFITIDLEEERKHSGRTFYLDSALSCMVYSLHSKRLVFDLKYNKKGKLKSVAYDDGEKSYQYKVKIGKKAIIFIKIMKNKNIFEGETKNGITTSNFRFITDWCFSFTNDEVLNENYYYPKYKLIKKK